MTLLDGAAAKNLRDLAHALDSGAMSLADARFKLQQMRFPRDLVDAIARWLRELHDRGWTAPQAALMVNALADERACVEAARDDIEVVWTGPDAVGSESRDQARVLEELFEAATDSVLIAGYNFRPGAHFDALARVARTHRALRVEVFAHVFIKEHTPLPEALAAHDTMLRAALHGVPASQRTLHRPSASRIEEARLDRFHMHAKCVIVDNRRVLITSANFSYTAQEKNIEVGIVLDDARLASRVRAQFEALVKRGDMVAHAL